MHTIPPALNSLLIVVLELITARHSIDCASREGAHPCAVLFSERELGKSQGVCSQLDM